MSIPSSGSSTACSASTTSSFVGMPRVYSDPVTRGRAPPHEATSVAQEADFLATLPREEVDSVGEPHPVAAGAHDQRVCAGAVGEKADAAQEVAVRDPGGGNDHLAGDEIVDAEHLLDVLDAVFARRVDLVPGRRPE